MGKTGFGNGIQMLFALRQKAVALIPKGTVEQAVFCCRFEYFIEFFLDGFVPA